MAVATRSTSAPRTRAPRLAAAVVATLAAGATLAAAVTPASAGTTVHARYRVTGSTYIAAPNFTLSLGPGKLHAAVNLKTGKLTASLTLPDATGSFTEGGIIPVSATTQFINDGPTTGRVNVTNGSVRTKSKITLRIVSLTVAGIPVSVGNSCQTKRAVVVRLTSQPGFTVLGGGNLAGGYTIGDFSHCGVSTLLINLTIPGSGNTISLRLGKARTG